MSLGVTIVQYRDKTSDTKDLILTARKLHQVTKKYGVPLLINDRVDVALAIGAEGVHLGQDDMSESFSYSTKFPPRDTHNPGMQYLKQPRSCCRRMLSLGSVLPRSNRLRKRLLTVPTTWESERCSPPRRKCLTWMHSSHDECSNKSLARQTPRVFSVHQAHKPS